MSKYFSVLVAADESMDGKSYYSGQAKTQDKSIDAAIQSYTINKMDVDQILAIRTYDDIGSVSLKSIRSQIAEGIPQRVADNGYDETAYVNTVGINAVTQRSLQGPRY